MLIEFLMEYGDVAAGFAISELCLTVLISFLVAVLLLKRINIKC